MPPAPAAPPLPPLPSRPFEPAVALAPPCPACRPPPWRPRPSGDRPADPRRPDRRQQYADNEGDYPAPPSRLSALRKHEFVRSNFIGGGNTGAIFPWKTQLVFTFRCVARGRVPRRARQQVRHPPGDAMPGVGQRIRLFPLWATAVVLGVVLRPDRLKERKASAIFRVRHCPTRSRLQEALVGWEERSSCRQFLYKSQACIKHTASVQPHQRDLYHLERLGLPSEGRPSRRIGPRWRALHTLSGSGTKTGQGIKKNPMEAT